jgi:hypothetical protein
MPTTLLSAISKDYQLVTEGRSTIFKRNQRHSSATSGSRSLAARGVGSAALHCVITYRLLSSITTSRRLFSRKAASKPRTTALARSSSVP